MDAFSLQPLDMNVGMGTPIPTGLLVDTPMMDQVALDQGLFSSTLANLMNPTTQTPDMPKIENLLSEGFLSVDLTKQNQFALSDLTLVNPTAPELSGESLVSKEDLLTEVEDPEAQPDSIQQSLNDLMAAMSAMCESLNVQMPKDFKVTPENLPELSVDLEKLEQQVDAGLSPVEIPAKMNDLLAKFSTPLTPLAVEMNSKESVKLEGFEATTETVQFPTLPSSAKSNHSPLPIGFDLPKEDVTAKMNLKSLDILSEESVKLPQKLVSGAETKNQIPTSTDMSKVLIPEAFQKLLNQTGAQIVALDSRIKKLPELVSNKGNEGGKLFAQSEFLGSEGSEPKVDSKGLNNESLRSILKENEGVVDVTPKKAMEHLPFQTVEQKNPKQEGDTKNLKEVIQDSKDNKSMEVAANLLKEQKPVTEGVKNSADSQNMSAQVNSPELDSKPVKGDFILDHKRELPAQPIHQVARQVQIQVVAGVQTMKLILNPEHLGAVDIDVQVEDHKVQLSLNVENEEAKKILEKDIGHLRQSLEAQNLKLDKVELTVNPDHQNRSAAQNFQEAKEQFHGEKHKQGGRGGHSPSNHTNHEEEPQEKQPSYRLFGYNQVEYTA